MEALELHPLIPSTGEKGQADSDAIRDKTVKSLLSDDGFRSLLKSIVQEANDERVNARKPYKGKKQVYFDDESAPNFDDRYRSNELSNRQRYRYENAPPNTMVEIHVETILPNVIITITMEIMVLMINVINIKTKMVIIIEPPIPVMMLHLDNLTPTIFRLIGTIRRITKIIKEMATITMPLLEMDLIKKILTTMTEMPWKIINILLLTSQKTRSGNC